MPPTDGLRGQLERGVAGTRKIPGKHGAAPVSYRQVVVAIPDEPGALARLFAEVGEAGVNVEDIAIEHDPDREIGYLASRYRCARDRPNPAVDRGWHVSRRRLRR